jgi:diadenosine tetraphosphatase ApaH/serine/threonine PP2A family protein phosphatase
MARLAIISDIHGNFEALQAVLKDIAQAGAKRIICLGDVVGYGPNPVECMDAARDFDVVLCGNHEWACVNEPLGFHATARQALNWTAKRLRPRWSSLGHKVRRWRFTKRLPARHQEGRLLFVHGSPRSPIEEYILRSDVDEVLNENTPKVQDALDKTDWITFVGHSHTPGIITQNARYIEVRSLEDGKFICDRDAKYIVNVGSVGQPRDRDWRACYVLFDPDSGEIEYRRVEYEADKTVDKIKRIPEIDDSLGERLKIGS